MKISNQYRECESINECFDNTQSRVIPLYPVSYSLDVAASRLPLCPRVCYPTSGKPEIMATVK